jgi:hypothetical protein
MKVLPLRQHLFFSLTGFVQFCQEFVVCIMNRSCRRCDQTDSSSLVLETSLPVDFHEFREALTLLPGRVAPRV